VGWGLACLPRTRSACERALPVTVAVEDQAPITLVSHGLASDGLCEGPTLLLLVWVFGGVFTMGSLRLVDYTCTD
jgi:hypothetical protein